MPRHKYVEIVDPSAAPTGIGHHWINTVLKKSFLSVGTSSVADWQFQEKGDDQIAAEVPFTPDGDIAATDMQAGLVEVRDDTDTKLSGKAATSHPHTLADVTDSGALAAKSTVATADIDNDAVTYEKMQNISATQLLLGRNTAGAGNTEELTPATTRTMLNVEDGATADQSDAEVKTAYEANTDTNEFSDSEQTKLAGIATAATANDTDANLKARANHTGTQLASTISDFDAEVANEAAVVANTAKVTNAIHTGEVTGGTALTVDKTAITGKTLVTAVGTDHFLIADKSDSDNLKEALVSDVLGAVEGHVSAIKPSDETLASNTTLQDDNDLKFAILSGEMWVFEFVLFVSEAANNPNIKLRLAATLGLTGTIEYQWVKISTALGAVISDFTTDTGGIALITTKETLLITGSVKATANGTLHLQWAQDTSDVDVTTVHALSKLVASRT